MFQSTPPSFPVLSWAAKMELFGSFKINSKKIICRFLIVMIMIMIINNNSNNNNKPNTKEVPKRVNKCL
jgi:hypothetical protein